jgi:hypothetical protein
MESQPLPIPAAPVSGRLGQQALRRRRLIREYEDAAGSVDDLLIQARNSENHAAQALKAKTLADAGAYAKQGLLGEDNNGSGIPPRGPNSAYRMFSI